MDAYVMAQDISSSVRIITEYERLTTEAQPTRRSPIQVLTYTYVA